LVRSFSSVLSAQGMALITLMKILAEQYIKDKSKSSKSGGLSCNEKSKSFYR
jgi:hypothetical protein